MYPFRRSQFQDRTLTSRPWYSKTWKRSADTECKILENSVGLSFLQTYSDEEEENETEEIISNSVREKDNTSKLEKSLNENEELELSIIKETLNTSKNEIEERETLTPDEEPNDVQKYQMEQNRNTSEEVKAQRKEEQEQGKVSRLEEVKKQKEESKSVERKKKDELNETRKAIKVLEEELERRKALRIEEEEKETRKSKKKKKAMKNEVTSDSEEEDKFIKQKKKKRVKTKKKYVESEDESSSDEKLKKSKKKSKHKKEKLKKKKSKKGDITEREAKVKKKDKEKEGDNDQTKGVEEAKKKKSKNESEVRCEDFEETETKKKKSAKDEESSSKKKRKSRPDNSYCSEEMNSQEECEMAGKLMTQHSEDFKESFSESLQKKGKIENSAKENVNRQEKDRNRKSSEDDIWNRKQKSNQSFEIPTHLEEDSKRKRECEIETVTDERKSKERLKDRSRSRDDGHGKPSKSDRYETENRLNKSRRISEDLEHANFQKKRENSREMVRHGDKFDKQKDNKHRLESVCVKNEPDWENLRSKRNKHRFTDYKGSPDEFVGFPLEKDMYLTKEKDKDSGRSKESSRHEVGTPDTEEYRENWEKDPYPIWESEDEAPVKVREKQNSSWESDEEIFERGHNKVKEIPRPLPVPDTFDLEIPLNIKPFKRREIIDTDTELELLKQQSVSLSEERRRLEIEKVRVKELELQVIKEAESKVYEDKKQKRRRTKDEEENRSRKNDPGKKDSLEKEIITPKRGRWDKKISSPKMSTPKANIIDVSRIKKEILDDEDSSTNVSSTTSVNTSAVLENEYEEFMKALTSSPKKPQDKTRMRKSETSDSERPKREIKKSVEVQAENNMTNEVECVVPHIVTILPKDIPLIPMPLPKTEIKPVPVPSPQIELDKIPKPLINLSLSANITLDIAPKFTTPSADSPSTTVNTLQAVITQLPEVEKSSSVSLLSDSTLDDADKRLTDKPFAFTSMVLPSKRPLLNSNLNLGDSDDEDKPVKSLPKLEDVITEDKTESNAKVIVDKVEAESEKMEMEKVKLGEKEEKKVDKSEMVHTRSPMEKDKRRRSLERYVRRDISPKRSSHGRRETSPRRRGRDSPPRRRGYSPKRHSPRRRSPIKRRSPGM